MKRILSKYELMIRILSIIDNLYTDLQKIRAIKCLIYEQFDIQEKELFNGKK